MPIQFIAPEALVLRRLYSSLAIALAVLVSATALPLPAQTLFGGYPSARMGGNYMHNFYFPPAPSSTPWYPSWSPDGESIAVAMQGSIWSVEVVSGLATELVS